MVAPYLLTLADFVAHTRLADLPDDVVARGRLILADTIGCIVAGNAEPPIRALRSMEQARAAPGATMLATVLGTETRLPPEAAAFVNGAASAWHDLDEGNLHTRGHAMIQLLPAALAEAEAHDRSGADLLEAAILAYEAASRLWRATRVRLAVHPHGTFGPLATAFALARLRGDSPAATAEAVSIAATLGVTSSRQTLVDGATVRNIYTAHSARAGYLALDLRDAGFSGEHDPVQSVFGGIYGDAFDPDVALAGLGQVWWIRKNYFKRFASARYLHGALDAIEALQARLGPRLNADSVERIDVDTYFMVATMGGQTIRSAFGARFSIPIAIAGLLLFGIAEPDDDGSTLFADPRVHALARRIFVTENPALTAAYPAHQPAVVTVRLTDGSVATERVDIILGESDNPFAPTVLRDKFRALTRAAWDNAQAWDRLLRIDAEPSIAQLTADWRAAVRAQKGSP